MGELSGQLVRYGGNYGRFLEVPQGIGGTGNPAMGGPGSITTGYLSPSGTYHLHKLRQTTTGNLPITPP